MKKTRFWLIPLVVFLVLVLFAGVFISKKTPSTKTPVNTGPQVINQYETILYEEKKRFSISLLPQENRYIITIYGSPFETIRQEAETRFVETLKITNPQACTLSVTIETLVIVNPDEATKKYALSFCENPDSGVSLPLNPQISPLTITLINPPGGKQEIGNTRAAMFITFSESVNINTLRVQITPGLNIATKQHPQQKNQITITPQTSWESNITYTVIIKAGAFSENGLSQLKQDVVVTYSTIEAPIPTFSPEGI